MTRAPRAARLPRLQSAPMRALLVSDDPAVREEMALVVRSLQRTVGSPVEFIEASDGLVAVELAWRARADWVIADEVCVRQGAFALARDLKGADPPFPGAVVLLLDRRQDAWLASWSGADAWFVKPVNPFEVGDRLAQLAAGDRREAG